MKQAIGYSMIALQVFFQESPAFAGIFRADEQSVAQTAMEAGRVLQGNNSGDATRQVLTSPKLNCLSRHIFIKEVNI